MDAAPPATAPPPAVPQTANWFPLVGGAVGVVVLLAVLGFGLGRGPVFGFLPVLGLLGIVVAIGFAMSMGRSAGATAAAPAVTARPGYPAPFGAPFYGLPRESTRMPLRERLRYVPPKLRAIHVGVLWSLVGLVAIAGVLVLGAIVFGPSGDNAAPAGLILLFGWVMTVAAYFTAGYRAFLPAAVALFVYGLMLHVDAVTQAWDLRSGWETQALLLFAALAAVQCLAAEAAFRKEPRVLWAAWATVGTLAAATLPFYLFAHTSDSYSSYIDRRSWQDITEAISFASLPWGLAAAFAYGNIPNALRWAGIAVFAAWSVSIVFALGWHTGLGGRLQRKRSERCAKKTLASHDFSSVQIVVVRVRARAGSREA
ncbi:MAG: hypothetical protein ABR562_08280 [Thermoplasmatota archaeon]